MANNLSQGYAPHLVEPVVEVPGHVLGRSVIARLQGTFSARGQRQLGDYFMDQSRRLLDEHLELIEFDTQMTLREHYDLLV